jgi:hypothetical protein
MPVAIRPHTFPTTWPKINKKKKQKTYRVVRGAVYLIFDAFVLVFNLIDVHPFHFGTAGMDRSNALALAALNTCANFLLTDKAALFVHHIHQKDSGCVSVLQRDLLTI